MNTKALSFTPSVRHVRHLCGIVCGIKSLIHKGCAACAASFQLPHTCVRVQVCACRRTHTPPQVCADAAHAAHAAHTHINHALTCTPMPHTMPHMPHTRAPSVYSFHFFKKEKEMPKRTIRCTAENAAQVQRLVKADAELTALVQSLQAQNLFPGLRGLTFTLVGDENHIAKGLDAWPLKNAPAPV